jgi:hypothetical protein
MEEEFKPYTNVESSATIIHVRFKNVFPLDGCKTLHLNYELSKEFWDTFTWGQKIRFRIWIWLSGKSEFKIIKNTEKQDVD